MFETWKMDWWLCIAKCKCCHQCKLFREGKEPIEAISLRILTKTTSKKTWTCYWKSPTDNSTQLLFFIKVRHSSQFHCVNISYYVGPSKLFQMKFISIGFAITLPVWSHMHISTSVHLCSLCFFSSLKEGFLVLIKNPTFKRAMQCKRTKTSSSAYTCMRRQIISEIGCLRELWVRYY